MIKPSNSRSAASLASLALLLVIGVVAKTVAARCMEKVPDLCGVASECTCVNFGVYMNEGGTCGYKIEVLNNMEFRWMEEAGEPGYSTFVRDWEHVPCKTRRKCVYDLYGLWCYAPNPQNANEMIPVGQYCKAGDEIEEFEGSEEIHDMDCDG